MQDERVELEKVLPAEEVEMVRPGYPRSLAYPDAGGGGYGNGYGYAESSSDGGVNIRELWRRVRKRKWLITILVVIVTSVVTVDVYRTKSTYQASATIEVGRDSTTLLKTGNLLVQSDDADNIKTKMLVLRSRPLLEDVVGSLQLDQNPRFLDVDHRKTVGEALRTITDKLRNTPVDAPPNVAPVLDASGENAAPVSVRTEEESIRLKPYVDVLAKQMTIEQVPETRALIVSFTHTDPAIAAAVANGTARHFIALNFENKTEKFTKTAEWLDVTTRKLQSKVEQAEQALANYTREHNIFSADPKDAFATEKLGRLQDQVMRAENELILKQSLYEEVRQGRLDQLPEAYADTRIAALQSKLNELATVAAELDVKFGPDNPKVREINQQMMTLREQIDAGRGGLESKLKGDYERAVREERALRAAWERAKSEAVQQNQANIQYSILKQDVDTAKALYTEFLQKTSHAEVQRAEQQNNMRLIEPAQVPSRPVGPKRLQSIVLGFLVSLLGGIGLAFLLEHVDNTIKTVEDVNRYTQLPALSVIPAIAAGATPRYLNGKKAPPRQLPRGNASRALRYPSSRESGLIALENRSSAAEAYRVLRTSVLLSSAGKAPKTILITSGQPGEGKTTTAINTAISLAQLGASVVVVDCDLRKPSVHKVFGLDFSGGISTYLSSNVEVDGLIKKLPIPNLSVLPCGPIPPNPAELISSERMKTLLATLGERYDHILMDSPPLIHVTDPVILSTMVDGVILVVHGGKSTREVARRARQELINVGAKIFGVVLNNVDLRKEGYSDYSYYRYYAENGQDA